MTSKRKRRLNKEFNKGYDAGRQSVVRPDAVPCSPPDGYKWTGLKVTNGYSNPLFYGEFIRAGWTDDLLVQHGYMVRV